MSCDEKEPGPAAETRKRGRPRCWSDTRSRQQAHRERQREKLRLVDELLHAARNAHWEDREEQRQIDLACGQARRFIRPTRGHRRRQSEHRHQHLAPRERLTN